MDGRREGKARGREEGGRTMERGRTWMGGGRREDKGGGKERERQAVESEGGKRGEEKGEGAKKVRRARGEKKVRRARGESKGREEANGAGDNVVKRAGRRQPLNFEQSRNIRTHVQPQIPLDPLHDLVDRDRVLEDDEAALGTLALALDLKLLFCGEGPDVACEGGGGGGVGAYS